MSKQIINALENILSETDNVLTGNGVSSKGNLYPDVEKGLNEALTHFKDNSENQFTYLEMEAALCIWEWIDEVTLKDSPQFDTQWSELREDIGAMGIRPNVIQHVSKWLLKVYDLMNLQNPELIDDRTYDYQIIPTIMEFCKDHEGKPTVEADKLPDPDMVVVYALENLKLLEGRK